MRNSGTPLKVIGGFLVLVGLIGGVYALNYYLGIGGESEMVYTSDYWGEFTNWHKAEIIFTNLLPFAIICAGGALWKTGSTLDRFEMELMDTREPTAQKKSVESGKSAVEGGGRGGYCTNCGAEVNPGDEFCLECGQELE